MAKAKDATDTASNKPRADRWKDWARNNRVLAVVISVGAILIFVAAVTEAVTGLESKALHLYHGVTPPIRSEEALVSSLSAGEDFSRFTAGLGNPDTKRPRR